MRRLLILLIVLPLTASAIEYHNLGLLYTDAPFTPAENTAISVLTHLGAVKGNPDGSFAPNRSLNRAEFLKIVFESYPKIRVSKSDAARCFPDVQMSDWFSRYVCLAKKRGMVSGYPDGTFKPGRAVNYAEAIKIFGELYGYIGPRIEEEPWYIGYVRGGQFRKVLLPISLGYDQALKRGQMARLASAYLAASEGEIDMYRLAERDLGRVIAMQRTPEEEESSSSSSSSESVSSSSSASSVASNGHVPDYPARSRFLMLGSRTEPIADGTFIPIKDPVEVRIVEVELRREIQSLEKLFLVGEDGTEIGELKLLSTDADNKTWKGTFDTGIYILPAKEGTVLGIEAKMKDRGTDGGPDELLEVIKFKVWVSSTEEVASYQLVPTGAHYPKHQTVQGELTNVENLITETGTLLNQNNATLAEFRFSSDALDGVQVNIENLSFAVTAPDSVMVINWKLKAIDEESEYNCSKDLIGNVNCLNIPFDIGLVENQTTLQLIGDITLDPGESGHALDIDLLSAGHIGMNGSVWWSDGTGNYTWIDKEDPLALGARWR